MALCAMNAHAGRTVTHLDFGWKFHAGDIQQAAATDYNDNDWRTINLPHDFQIEQPWVEPSPDERPDNTDVAANIKSRLSSRGFKEMGKGWYGCISLPMKPGKISAYCSILEVSCMWEMCS